MSIVAKPMLLPARAMAVLAGNDGRGGSSTEPGEKCDGGTIK